MWTILGANLGVVTWFNFRLREIGPTVYGGPIAWLFERAAEERVRTTYSARTGKV